MHEGVRSDCLAEFHIATCYGVGLYHFPVPGTALISMAPPPNPCISWMPTCFKFKLDGAKPLKGAK